VWTATACLLPLGPGSARPGATGSRGPAGPVAGYGCSRSTARLRIRFPEARPPLPRPTPPDSVEDPTGVRGCGRCRSEFTLPRAPPAGAHRRPAGRGRFEIVESAVQTPRFTGDRALGGTRAQWGGPGRPQAAADRRDEVSACSCTNPTRQPRPAGDGGRCSGLRGRGRLHRQPCAPQQPVCHPTHRVTKSSAIRGAAISPPCRRLDRSSPTTSVQPNPSQPANRSSFRSLRRMITGPSSPPSSESDSVTAMPGVGWRPKAAPTVGRSLFQRSGTTWTRTSASAPFRPQAASYTTRVTRRPKGLLRHNRRQIALPGKAPTARVGSSPGREPGSRTPAPGWGGIFSLLV